MANSLYERLEEWDGTKSVHVMSVNPKVRQYGKTVGPCVRLHFPNESFWVAVHWDGTSEPNMEKLDTLLESDRTPLGPGTKVKLKGTNTFGVVISHIMFNGIAWHAIQWDTKLPPTMEKREVLVPVPQSQISQGDDDED